MTSTDSLTPTCDAPQDDTLPADAVVAWLIDGHRDADVRNAIKEKWPQLDPVTIQTAAVEHFRRAAHCEPEVIVGFAIEAYRDLYRRMVKIGDFAGASKVVKELVAMTKHVQQFRDESENETEQPRTEEAAG